MSYRRDDRDGDRYGGGGGSRHGGGGGGRLEVCFDNQKGRCTRGSGCRFSHEGGDGGGGGDRGGDSYRGSDRGDRGFSGGGGGRGGGGGGGRPPPQIDNLFSLMVFNISYRTRKEELSRTFDKFGELADVYIPQDKSGESRGFAFVRYYKKHHADDACSLDGREVDGRRIGVQYAKYGRRPEPRGGGGGGGYRGGGDDRGGRDMRERDRGGRSERRRSRSRDRSRSRGRRDGGGDRSRSRSRGRDRDRPRRRYRSKSRSKSKSRSRSRSRKRSASKSRSRTPPKNEQKSEEIPAVEDKVAQEEAPVKQDLAEEQPEVTTTTTSTT